MKKKIFLLLIVLFSFVGCSSVLRDENYEVNREIRKEQNNFIDVIYNFVTNVRYKVYEGTNFKLYSTNKLFLIPVGDDTSNSCLDKGFNSKSPYSDTWKYAFVGVIYDGKDYTFYFIGEDGLGTGILFTEYKRIKEDNINLIETEMDSRITSYLMGKYSIKANDTHKLTDLEKNMYSMALKNFKNINEVVYIASKTCSYKQ